MESATGRSTAATAALLPRSRHSTTDDGGCAHGVARRGEAAVASNSSQTSAKVSVYPSALYYYWEQRRIAKGRKKAKALLELCRDVDYFYEAFYGLFRSLFKYIHYISPPHSLTGSSRKWIFLSQNTGRTEWLLTLSDRTPHMRIVMLILIYWAANQSQSRNTNIQFCWYTMIFPRLQPRQ